jgi:hypothetical protein
MPLAVPSQDANDHKTHTSSWIPLSMVSSLQSSTPADRVVNLPPSIHFHSPARHNHCSPGFSHRISSSTTACSYFDRWRRRETIFFSVDVDVKDEFRSACEKTSNAATITSRWCLSLCHSSLLSDDRQCFGTDRAVSKSEKPVSSAPGRGVFARLKGGRG